MIGLRLGLRGSARYTGHNRNIEAIPMPDRQLPTPSVPDLACVEGETRAEVIEWLTAYYVGDGCPWNYRVGTKAIKTAYRGFDRLDLLLASCQQIKNKQGRISNDEIIQLGAPKHLDDPHRSSAFPPGSSRSVENAARPIECHFSSLRMAS